MNDYWNDPPEVQEPPDWYSLLEEASLEPDIPNNIKTALRAMLDDWCVTENERVNSMYQAQAEDYFDSIKENHFEKLRDECNGK